MHPYKCSRRKKLSRRTNGRDSVTSVRAVVGLACCRPGTRYCGGIGICSASSARISSTRRQSPPGKESCVAQEPLRGCSYCGRGPRASSGSPTKTASARRPRRLPPADRRLAVTTLCPIAGSLRTDRGPVFHLSWISANELSHVVAARDHVHCMKNEAVLQCS